MNYIEKYVLVNKDIVGEAQGVLYDKDDNNWIYYLEREIVKKSDLEFFLNVILNDKNINKISILHNLEVLFPYRGKGYGKQLVSLFEDETKEADISILVADMLMSQKKNFRLIYWYQCMGYLSFVEQKDTVIMVKTKDEKIIQKLDLFLF